MCLYLRTKFKVSSIFLTSFRRGVGGEVKRSPKKPTQIRVKRGSSKHFFDYDFRHGLRNQRYWKACSYSLKKYN